MTRENGPTFSEKHGPDAQADPMAKDKIEIPPYLLNIYN